MNLLAEWIAKYAPVASELVAIATVAFKSQREREDGRNGDPHDLKRIELAERTLLPDQQCVDRSGASSEHEEGAGRQSVIPANSAPVPSVSAGASGAPHAEHSRRPEKRMERQVGQMVRLVLRLLQEARQSFTQAFVRCARTIRYCRMRGRGETIMSTKV